MINKLSPDAKKSAFPLSSLSMDEFHYILDENLCFRPEPGFDDGPPADLSDKCWKMPEPWAPELPPEQLPLIEQYINDISDLGRDEWQQEPYLEQLTHSCIPISEDTPEFDLEREISTSKFCRKGCLSLYDQESTSTYYKVLHCMKFWCWFCGGKGKKLHKRRKRCAYKKLNSGRYPANRAELRAAVGRWNLRQFVFTVPGIDRYEFMSWEGLNKLSGVVNRIMKEFFPGSRVLVYIHTIGDQDWSKFNPHINVHIFEPKKNGGRLNLAPEILIAISDRLARGLRCLGCSGIHGRGEDMPGVTVNYKYSYARKIKRILFKIKYMTRPLGPEHLEAWRQDKDGQKMIDLHIRELKGFQFLRSWGSWARNKYSDTEDVKQEVEDVAGRELEFTGYVSMSVILEKLKTGKVEKIDDDLYIERSRLTRNRSP